MPLCGEGIECTAHTHTHLQKMQKKVWEWKQENKTQVFHLCLNIVMINPYNVSKWVLLLFTVVAIFTPSLSAVNSLRYPCSTSINLPHFFVCVRVLSWAFLASDCWCCFVSLRTILNCAWALHSPPTKICKFPCTQHTHTHSARQSKNVCCFCICFRHPRAQTHPHHFKSNGMQIPQEHNNTRLHLSQMNV